FYLFQSLRSANNYSKLDTKKLQILFLWALFPVIFLFLVSVLYNPRFVPRYMLFSIPGLYLFIGYAFSRISYRKFLPILLLSVFLVLYIFHLNLSPQKPEEWRKMMSDFKELKDDETLTYCSASYMCYPVSYYYDKDIFAQQKNIGSLMAQEDIHFVNSIKGVDKSRANRYDKVILLLAHYTVVDPDKTLLNYFLDNTKLLEYKKYRSLELYQFKNSDTTTQEQLFFNMDSQVGFHSSIVQHDSAYSGEYVSSLNANTEYSFTYADKMETFSKQSVKALRITAMVRAISPVTNVQLVVEINGKNGRVFYESRQISSNLVLNEWCRIDELIGFDTDYDKKDEIKVYFWNASKESALIDDIKIN
ncbi:MAG: hypothetical protein R6U85_13450, partial [Salinivirgaceae bacterium]